MGHLLEQYVSSLSGLAVNVPEKPLRHRQRLQGQSRGSAQGMVLDFKIQLRRQTN